MFYPRVVIIFFSTGLYKSVFSTYSFGKPSFRLSVFLIFFSVCSKFWIRFNLKRLNNICIIIKVLLFILSSLYKNYMLIDARKGGFIVPYVWEIVVRKNVTNFEGCHFAWFYIFIWWSFPKIETKNFKSGSCFFKLGAVPPTAHFLDCVHIGRSQAVAAIICGLSSGKRFVKLREVFLRFLYYKHRKKL